MGHQRIDHSQLVEELHAQLNGRFAEMTTSKQWCDYLTTARKFHRYSAQNQLLLALQGAEGHVAGYRNWQRIPAQDGGICQVRKGEAGLKILAPLTSKTTDIDDTTGQEITRHRLRGFRTVSVFHEGQLISPPDIPEPILPELLTGENRWQHVWNAVTEHLKTDGFNVELHTRSSFERWNGMTMWTERVVKVAGDLEPPQRVKTLFHEWAHVQLDHEARHVPRSVKEVEAESVAYLLSQTVGIDSDPYSVPYIATWAAGDIDVVHAAAEQVLTTTKRLVTTLEHQLGIDLTPDTLDHTVADTTLESTPAPNPPSPTALPRPDQVGQLALELDGLDPPPVQDERSHIEGSDTDFLKAILDDLEPAQRHRFAELADDTTRVAELASIIATTGNTAGQTARALRSINFGPEAIRDALLAPVRDDDEQATLYTPDEARAALLQLDQQHDIDRLIPPPNSDPERAAQQLHQDRKADLTRVQHAIANCDDPARIAALSYGLEITAGQTITICAALDTAPNRTMAIAIALRDGDVQAATNDLIEYWPGVPGGWDTHAHPSIGQRPKLHLVPNYDTTRSILDRWTGRQQQATPPPTTSPAM